MSFVKFAFTAYTALFGVAFGLYQFSQKESVDLIPVAITILAVGFLLGVLMFCIVVRNRVYFVYVARYINEHRKFYLDKTPLDFPNETGMHVRIKRPQFFNWQSTDALYIYVLALLNSVMLASLLLVISPVWCSVVCGSVSLAAHVAGAVRYLRARENKKADEGVFGNTAD